MSRTYYIYIMTNKENRVLYTGVTGDLVNRVYQHRERQVQGFTSRYNVTKLVYFEMFNDPVNAIAREKQMKAGSREKKVKLIERYNPEWKDLYPEIASTVALRAMADKSLG
ncbi:MAG: GIY-YIG nuclease family protein [bacterium]|nr:GIY-YIG nuclease family protein [bacterium]